MILKIKKVINKRLLVVGILMSIVFIALVGRLTYLMIIKGAEYKQLASKQWTKAIKMAPRRGSILGRNGFELALNEDVYRIDVDLNVFKKYLRDKKIPEVKAAFQLSQKLNIKSGEVEKILDSKDGKGKPLQYVFLKRKVEKDMVDSIKALKYDGIIISRDIDRVYPNNNLLFGYTLSISLEIIIPSYFKRYR